MLTCVTAQHQQSLTWQDSCYALYTLQLELRARKRSRDLPPSQVSAKRRETGVLSAVTGAFSDELAAYSSAAGAASRASVWERGSPDALPLLEE